METKVIKSPLKYQGSKLKLVPWIKEIAQFNPDKEKWIEPFFGSGVVGLNMDAQVARVNDINPHVVNLFKMLNDNSYFLGGMKATLDTHDKLLRRFGEEYYYEMREHFNENFNPNTLLFLNHTCFNGVMRFNQKGKYNVPFCKKTDKLSESYREDLYNRLQYAKEVTKDWGFYSIDYKEMFMGLDTSCVVYLDPPYIDRTNNYYDSWTEKNELELHELVMNTPARVVLSTWYEANGKRNKYVESLWGDLNLHKKDHRYIVGQKKSNRYPVVEGLLTNF